MGSGTKCVGCHAGHSILPVPINASHAEWINVSPSAVIKASSNGVFPDGSRSNPQRLADRRAQTGGKQSFWMSSESDSATVSLSWTIPIEVREFVLYGIPPDADEKTTISMRNWKILLYYRASLVSRESPAGEALPEGTRFSVAPANIDSAVIVMRRSSGSIHGNDVVGLAEIETIARISSLNYQAIREGSK